MRYKALIAVLLIVVPLSVQAGSLDIGMGTISADPESTGLNLVVDSPLDLGDINPGDGACATTMATCTLRAAIEESNAYEGLDSITLPADTYVITSSLTVFDGLNVLGEDRDTTIIDADGADVALYIAPSLYLDSDVTIDSVTVRGSIQAGIEVLEGIVSLISSRVRDNSGYGVSCWGRLPELSILDSEVLENGSDGVFVSDCEARIVGSSISHNRGRGVIAYEGDLHASVTLEDSYVGDNLGGGLLGGGLAFLRLRSTTVANNSAVNGAGYASDHCGVLHAVNSTFSGNRATGHGGGIYIPDADCGSSSLIHTTIVENVADSDDDGIGDGGGIFSGVHPSYFEFSIEGTLLAKNVDLSGEAPDCAGPEALVSEGFNLIGDTAGCSFVGDVSSNITDVDPDLGPLADNGGMTPTHRPLVQSPAINAIPPDDCTVDVDQRGVIRPIPPGCEIGSIEVGLTCLGFRPPLNKKQVLLRGPYRRLPVKAKIVDADGRIQTGGDLLSAPVVRVVKLPASDLGYELGSFRFKNNGVWRTTVSAKDFPEKGRYLLFLDTGDSSEYLLDQTCSAIVKRR